MHTEGTHVVKFLFIFLLLVIYEEIGPDKGNSVLKTYLLDRSGKILQGHKVLH